MSLRVASSHLSSTVPCLVPFHVTSCHFASRSSLVMCRFMLLRAILCHFVPSSISFGSHTPSLSCVLPEDTPLPRRRRSLRGSLTRTGRHIATVTNKRCLFIQHETTGTTTTYALRVGHNTFFRPPLVLSIGCHASQSELLWPVLSRARFLPCLDAYVQWETPREFGKPLLATLLIYLDAEWSTQWDAETLFLDGPTGTGVFVRPRGGRAVVMDQDITHRISTPSQVLHDGLRKSFFLPSNPPRSCVC